MQRHHGLKKQPLNFSDKGAVVRWCRYRLVNRLLKVQSSKNTVVSVGHYLDAALLREFHSSLKESSNQTVTISSIFNLAYMDFFKNYFSKDLLFTQSNKCIALRNPEDFKKHPAYLERAVVPPQIKKPDVAIEKIPVKENKSEKNCDLSTQSSPQAAPSSKEPFLATSALCDQYLATIQKHQPAKYYYAVSHLIRACEMRIHYIKTLDPLVTPKEAMLHETNDFMNGAELPKATRFISPLLDKLELKMVLCDWARAIRDIQCSAHFEEGYYIELNRELDNVRVTSDLVQLLDQYYPILSQQRILPDASVIDRLLAIVHALNDVSVIKEWFTALSLNEMTQCSIDSIQRLIDDLLKDPLDNPLQLVLQQSLGRLLANVQCDCESLFTICKLFGDKQYPQIALSIYRESVNEDRFLSDEFLKDTYFPNALEFAANARDCKAIADLFAKSQAAQLCTTELCHQLLESMTAFNMPDTVYSNCFWFMQKHQFLTAAYCRMFIDYVKHTKDSMLGTLIGMQCQPFFTLESALHQYYLNTMSELAASSKANVQFRLFIIPHRNTHTNTTSSASTCNNTITTNTTAGHYVSPTG